MTDPHQPEQTAGEDEPGQDRERTETKGEEREATPSSRPEVTDADETDGSTESTTGSEEETPDAASADPDVAAGRRKQVQKGLLLGLGAGVCVGAAVVLILGFFVWPGFVTGPGSPDDKAAEITAALGSKDPAQLERVSCRGPDGVPTSQLPPQAMQLIQSASQVGPAQLRLDSEARAPIDMTLGVQGQTRTLPADVVLGVNDGEWCLNGLAERQQ